jgi:hypothetical protein
MYFVCRESGSPHDSTTLRFNRHGQRCRWSAR